MHERNSVVELVDPRLSEFNEEEIKRVVGISLLCTQASPMLQPSMSCVVVVLSGDIKVDSLTSKPAYLVEWKFEDMSYCTSLMTGMETKGSFTSHCSSSERPA